MNKEQIINEAYENYVKQNDDTVGRCDLWTLKKETFINKCKTNTEFSEKWGLKIEERELSREERVDLYISKYDAIDGFNYNQYKHTIPTKLITITYKDKTIESYE